MIKINLKDRRILYELDINGRLPLSRLAKNVQLSQQSVAYRLQVLKKKGVLKGFITLLDVAKFGYYAYRIYIRYQNVNIQKEKEILDYFYKHPNVFWFASMSGGWDLEVLIFAKNVARFNDILKGIMRNCGQHIRNYVLSIATDHFHFGRRYLVSKEYKKSQLYAEPIAYYGGEPKTLKLDKRDLRILALLANNARTPIINMAKKVNLVSNAVKHRIKRLTGLGVIQCYRAWIDIGKIGYELYKSLITLQNLTEEKEKQMLAFFKMRPNVLYFIKCIGRWDIEIEAEVRNNEEFRRILMDFRTQFHDVIKDYETLLVYKEHKICYFPLA